MIIFLNYYHENRSCYNNISIIYFFLRPTPNIIQNFCYGAYVISVTTDNTFGISCELFKTIGRTNRIYDGVEAETKKSQASCQII